MTTHRKFYIVVWFFVSMRSLDGVSDGLKVLLNNNPGMELEEVYKIEMPGESMTSVYLIAENGREKVVKMAPTSDIDKFYRGAKDQVLRETKVLQELNGFYNTPKFLGFYDLGSYIALARENLNFEYLNNWKGTGREKYQALNKMKDAFHEKKISGLDLQMPRNIAILDYNKNNFTLFDFGKSVIESENPIEFNFFAKQDNDDLFRMFSR